MIRIPAFAVVIVVLQLLILYYFSSVQQHDTPPATVETRDTTLEKAEKRATRLVADFHKRMKTRSEERNQLGICLVTWGETEFIEEFILHHALLGFDKFYVYDTELSDATSVVLSPYIDNGLVTLFRTPVYNIGFQYNSSNHCYKNFGKKSNWLGHWDTDEFITWTTPVGETTLNEEEEYPPERATPFLRLINDHLSASDAIIMTRVEMGNIYHVMPSNTLVMEAHHYRVVSSLTEKALTHTNYQSRVRASGAHNARITPETMKADPKSKMKYIDPIGKAIGFKNFEVNDERERRVMMFEPFRLTHYLHRSKANCLKKEQQRKKCCPNSWRSHRPKNWCAEQMVNITSDKAFVEVVEDYSLANSEYPIAIRMLMKEFNGKRREPMELDYEYLDYAITQYN